MSRIFRIMFAGVFGVVCLSLVCGAAQAQVQRTFVSTSGDDANTASNCPPTAPCRSFGAAIGVTNAGGEIVPLTSGGYGAVSIAKSLAITTPPGVYAGITVSSGHGITIAAAATDTIVLKGLTVNGLRTSDDLIEATSFGTLHLESCEVTNSGNRGVNVNISTAASVFLKDSIVRDSGDDGMKFYSSVAALNVLIENTRSEGNGSSGFYPANNTKMTARQSIAARNNTGFNVTSGGELNCDGCIASNNNFYGVFTLGLARVARSTVTNNTSQGFYNPGGTFETFGTNMVRGNNGGGAQTFGTITTVPSL